MKEKLNAQSNQIPASSPDGIGPSAPCAWPGAASLGGYLPCGDLCGRRLSIGIRGFLHTRNLQRYQAASGVLLPSMATSNWLLNGLLLAEARCPISAIISS